MNNRLSRVLAIRPFLFLFLAEIFSQIAMNMVNFALILVVFKLTKSNTAVSGIVVSYMIPAIFLGMLAGVLVDRWNKKFVLLVTNILRTAFLLLLAVFHTNLVIIYALSFLISIVTQFFIPAETPMIPLLVKKSLLVSANALFGMGIYGSMLVSYAISGPLLLWLGQTSLFLFLALLFWSAAIFVSLIIVPKYSLQEKNRTERVILINPPIERLRSTPLVDEMKNAVRLMVRTKAVYQAMLLLTLSQVLIIILSVVGPGFANEVLEIPVDKFPLYFVTPAVIGMGIAAVLIGNFWHKKHRNISATLGLLLSGISVFLLPYCSKIASRDFVHAINTLLPIYLRIDILHIMVVLAFILGIANALLFVPSNTILQEETSDAFRGKVYGTLNVLVGIFSLFPTIVVGELADLIGVGRVLTGIGSGILILSLFRLLYSSKK